MKHFRMKILMKFLPIIIFIITVCFFFSPVLLQGKLPIPSDTIVGLYHPFRDLYAGHYPNGIPYKNSLITDPVRQQYPWRFLTISLEKSITLPLWNPYTFNGTPLLANMQSAAFYPLNVLFWLLPFATAWSGLIFLQLLLAGVFMYIYLNNLKINRFASLLGSLAFAFSGFFTSWLEWGTVAQTLLWLPLILLSIDKLVIQASLRGMIKDNHGKQNKQARFVKNKKKHARWSFFIQGVTSHAARVYNDARFWSLIVLISLICSLFAGHLQVFFYVFLLSVLYFLMRWIQFGRSKRIFLLLCLILFCFLLLTIMQWLPLLQFIQQSARDVDQLNKWYQTGWFIPWQHLIQFVAPDFFGNPTTMNYWGVWNYGEFIGYIGIVPLLFALLALFFRHDRKTIFFGVILLISLLFSLPTGISALPFILHVPLLATAQPTRLLAIIDFCLAVLAAFGADYYCRLENKKQILYQIGGMAAVFFLLWTYIVIGHKIILPIPPADVSVAKRNVYFPTVLFMLSVLIFSIDFIFPPDFFTKLLQRIHLKKNKKRSHIRRNVKKTSLPHIRLIILVLLLLLTVFDLVRFSQKFTPFTDSQYLFPQTKTLQFLQNKVGNNRIMATDPQILPPNFSIMYHLQSVDGYDPLYLLRYGELIAASERNKPDITPPFGFNRIITPHNYDSRIMDLLGVKYVLSLSPITSAKLEKVFSEGQTQ